MGKKIHQRQFEKADFDEFSHRVQEETTLLQAWCRDGLVTEHEKESGFELEVWLLNQDYRPAANNLHFIKSANYSYLTSEAAQSCLEINLPMGTLHNHALRRHNEKLSAVMKECSEHARKQSQHIIAIGTLPNAKHSDYTDLTLTNENRYHAINNRLSILREHHESRLRIAGKGALDLPINSFSIVGAMSSFQIHFRIGAAESARLFNAAIALSAFTVALSGNSPFLFGQELWEESRIPFYEQILLTKNILDHSPRVTFGSGYIKNSLLELFIENNTNYSPLLPQVSESALEKMVHLQLHNGNIYRWNRPVLDFDDQSKPHFRIEHRPLSSGPTAIDMIANAAFYYGITHYYMKKENPVEHELPFAAAKENFYQAAKYGLLAEVLWLDNKKIVISELILTQLLPQAKEGLKQLDFDSIDIEYYISIIEERVRKKQTGSQWQRQFYIKNGKDFKTLTEAYIELQNKGNPVHDWPTE